MKKLTIGELRDFLFENTNEVLPDEFQASFIELRSQQIHLFDREQEAISFIFSQAVDGRGKPLMSGPCVLLLEMYENYLASESIEDFCLKLKEHLKRLMLFAERNKFSHIAIDSANYTKEDILNKVVISLCPADEELENELNAFSVNYLDLKVYLRIITDQTNDSISTVLLTNDIIKSFQIDKKELLKKAKSNYIKLFKPTFERLRPESERENGLDPICEPFVLSNKYTFYGSSYIYFDKILKMIGKSYNGDFYMMPTAVDAALILSYDNSPLSLKDLKKYIRSVASTIPEEKFLTEKIYLYHYDSGKIEIL